MFKAPNEGRASRSYLRGDTFPCAVACVDCVERLRCYCVCEADFCPTWSDYRQQLGRFVINLRPSRVNIEA